MADPQIRILDAPPATTTGECPVWDGRTGHLWWIDIQRPTLHRVDVHGQRLESWTLPEHIGSFALCRSGGLLVALRSGVHRFDPVSGALELLVAPEPDRPRNRLNDGKASPEGRFLVGSMDDTDDKEAGAALYSISADGSCRRLVDGLIISNGLAWSPDGRTLWHSDTRHARIWTADYDPETGTIGPQREVAQVPNETGRPDGGATDVEGGYWSAGVSAGVLNRWLPDGTLDRQIKLPVKWPTMPCFGGPDMRTLYVTSLRKDGDGPIEGSLLELRMEVAGVPVGLFAD
ncbi:SMP-30/gluconolactonase/LRE family protein [Roseomonas elaeocarpi]|uniref:SMP-30/gluconolactonase/LRE family protein n=1 Tax=Roseomonas elaeocarpi TaxID=907779 RepID=A0ABV6JXA2_9PROT